MLLTLLDGQHYDERVGHRLRCLFHVTEIQHRLMSFDIIDERKSNKRTCIDNEKTYYICMYVRMYFQDKHLLQIYIFFFGRCCTSCHCIVGVAELAFPSSTQNALPNAPIAKIVVNNRSNGFFLATSVQSQRKSKHCDK